MIKKNALGTKIYCRRAKTLKRSNSISINQQNRSNSTYQKTTENIITEPRIQPRNLTVRHLQFLQ